MLLFTISLIYGRKAGEFSARFFAGLLETIFQSIARIQTVIKMDRAKLETMRILC